MSLLLTAEDARGFGRRLGAAAGAGEVIALVGELGAGKTEVTKGIATGLGFPGDVTSPTFTLVHEYRGGRLPLFHFDFYRLESAQEVIALGWEEAAGVCAIEWPEKFPELLPARARWWRLEHGVDGARNILAIEPPDSKE
jgi:tRNA threonylcarbamoyladenosine biosynthesis protein TsaE